MTGLAFDRLAEQYDALWTSTAIGRAQRDTVWRWIFPLFRPGDSILDLGCGTGEDACRLMKDGVDVCGIDASAEMVRIARDRGVKARQLPLENLHELEGYYDGAISNFGTLNCVDSLSSVGTELGRLIRCGGPLAICIIGPFCLWETCHFLRRAQFRKAFRRWLPSQSSSSLGIHVAYPSIRNICTALQPHFRLVRWCGVGLFVPPSYVPEISQASVVRLATADRYMAHWPLLRALADHRLLLFTRV